MTKSQKHRTDTPAKAESGGNDAGGRKSGKGNDLDGKPLDSPAALKQAQDSGGSDTPPPTGPKTGDLGAEPPAD